MAKDYYSVKSSGKDRFYIEDDCGRAVATNMGTMTFRDEDVARDFAEALNMGHDWRTRKHKCGHREE